MRSLVVLAAAAVLSRSAAAADAVTVSVGAPLPEIPTVPGDFASFSYEVSCVVPMFQHAGGPRATFVALLQNLKAAARSLRGPNIRIGGNSADESVFLPPSTPLPPGDKYRITPADFAAYLAAVPLWNGTFTPGLNFRAAGGDPAFAVAHVRGLAAAVPLDSPFIDGFEIGNENDLYFENGIRPSNYDAATYAKEWARVVTALAAPAGSGGGGVPMPRVQALTFGVGPPAKDGFDSAVAGTLTRTDAISSASWHHYPLSVCPAGSGKRNSIYSLLSNTAADKGVYGRADSIAAYAAAARARGTRFFIGEGNSFSCGGEAGISDAFAATLWALDAMFVRAQVGVSRWNFHGCPSGPYTAIAYENTADDAPDVRPLYYAMWAFATATANGAALLNVTTASSNALIRAYAAADADGAALRVVLIHKDANATSPAAVTVRGAGGRAGAGSLVRLAPAAGGIFAKSGLAFGGLTFDGSTDGRPRGTPTSEPVPFAGGAWSFALPPASIAILTLTT